MFKTMILFAAIFLAYSAQAANDDVTRNYVCKITGRDQTVLLKHEKDLPVGKDEDIEIRARYELQIQTTELPFPGVVKKGVVESADVQLDFNSDDKSIAVTLFLDDMAGTLYEGKVETEITDCRQVR